MFISEKEPQSVASESYRILRTNIEYSSFDKSLKTIVVTSSEANEGKTTTAGNLAISLAQNEKKVLLIDCDLRKGSLHRRFRVSNGEGLSEIIIGKSTVESAVKEVAKNLDIITTGNLPPNPSEMLGSNAMKVLINNFREVYDYIIFDTPPVLSVTDAQVLSGIVDGVLLVTSAEKTKRDNVINAKRLLDKVKANVIGVVFNKVDPKKTNYYSYRERNGKEPKKVRKRFRIGKEGRVRLGKVLG